MNLTRSQKRALFQLAEIGHEYGGLGWADGRSAQELIKRYWAEGCIEVRRGMGGVMTCEMQYVITAKGRKAAIELGWEPGAKWWMIE